MVSLGADAKYLDIPQGVDCVNTYAPETSIFQNYESFGGYTATSFKTYYMFSASYIYRSPQKTGFIKTINK